MYSYPPTTGKIEKYILGAAFRQCPDNFNYNDTPAIQAMIQNTAICSSKQEAVLSYTKQSGKAMAVQK